MIQAIEPLTEEPITLSTEGLRQMYVIIKQSMRGRSQSVYNVEQDIAPQAGRLRIIAVPLHLSMYLKNWALLKNIQVMMVN